MKQVIVLVDDELQQSKLLHNDFGTIDHNKWLCIAHKPNIQKVFIFQTFGLLINDKKMDEYMHIKDGITIIVNSEKINKNIIDRIKTISLNNQHIPILLYLDDTMVNSNASTKMQCEKPWALSSNEIKEKQLINSQNELTKQFKIIIEQLSSKFNNFKYFTDTYTANNWFNDAVNKSNPNKKEIKITSTTINSDVMVQQFQNATLPLQIWDHYGRLRIVHYSLMKYGYANTIDQNGWLCKHWKIYKTTIGHGNLWHYSLTRFWVNIIYNLQQKNNHKTFDELYNANTFLHNGSLFKKYYSDDVIFTQKARNEWIPPNLNNFI